MRISDCSSDVCSSDLVEANHQLGFPADAREYDLAIELLRQLDLRKIRLMTNNPRKLDALTKVGIEITERVPLESGRNPYNEKYLDAKARSEERRVGKEWVSTCRYRGSPYP